MTASTLETILAALTAAIAAEAPFGATVLRNAVLPESIPAGGLVIVRDGEPGDPETTLSPLTYHFEHRAEIDIAVEAAHPAARDATFDALRRAIGAAVAADRTLGGRCDWIEAEAAGSAEIPLVGAAAIKAATIPVILTFATTDPLS